MLKYSNLYESKIGKRSKLVAEDVEACRVLESLTELKELVRICEQGSKW